VGILDVDRVRAELGPRLGDRFLQYATAPDEEEAHRLLVHIDQHLAHMTRHLGGDLPLPIALASRCKRLLMRYDESGPEERAAIAGAVRYFLETHDLERDDEPSGFDDDAKVMNYVVEGVAPELGKVS
jgi:hypothetical protein